MKRIYSHLYAFVRGYYNVLLTCLLVLFVIRPEQREAWYYAAWKFFFTLTVLSAVYNTNRTRRFRSMALSLALPSIALTWIDLFFQHELVFVTNDVFTLCFLILITAAIIYDALRGKSTVEALKGVICAYFMVGLAFSYLYYLIGYFLPGAFSLTHFPELDPLDHPYYLSQMLYYSFVTILQIGYGDITAIAAAAQSASILEGMFGQFYIAILVARIVSVYSAYDKQR